MSSNNDKRKMDLNDIKFTKSETKWLIKNLYKVEDNNTRCIYENCNKVLSGYIHYNLIRHLRTCHDLAELKVLVGNSQDTRFDYYTFTIKYPYSNAISLKNFEDAVIQIMLQVPFTFLDNPGFQVFVPKLSGNKFKINKKKE